MFSPPIFPPTLTIAEGKITGHSMHFLFGAGEINCPYHAAISMAGGEAVGLSGSGRCIEPGHPLSGIPLPPPAQAGSSPTVSWEATRS